MYVTIGKIMAFPKLLIFDLNFLNGAPVSIRIDKRAISSSTCLLENKSLSEITVFKNNFTLFACSFFAEINCR